MGDTLALVQLAKAFANANDEVDPLLNILPRYVLGELPNGLQRDFLARHRRDLLPYFAPIIPCRAAAGPANPVHPQINADFADYSRRSGEGLAHRP